MSATTPSIERWAVGVVDVENDFCEGGSLAVAGGADVASRIHQWLADEPARWVARFATADRHPAELVGPLRTRRHRTRLRRLVATPLRGGHPRCRAAPQPARRRARDRPVRRALRQGPAQRRLLRLRGLVG